MEETNFNNSNKIPDTLYKQTIDSFVESLRRDITILDKINLYSLPPDILIDVYFKMALCAKLKNAIYKQLSNLDVLVRLIRFGSSQQKLIRAISIMVKTKSIAEEIKNIYISRYALSSNFTVNKSKPRYHLTSQTFKQIYIYNKIPLDEEKNSNCYLTNEYNMEIIDIGLLLGSFFSEAGWLNESIGILDSVWDKLQCLHEGDMNTRVSLDCLQRKLNAEATLFSFESATKTSEIIEKILNSKIDIIPDDLIINTYTQLSALFFARSEYDQSHKWIVLALKLLKPRTPERIVIDVLRQAAKSCVVKREFKRANMLILQAVKRARLIFGKHHQKYADTLIDYGFFLLNVDSIDQSVTVYQDALDIRRHIFGNRNFHVAVAHEDLSYAFYVHEYSSGNFHNARENIDKAIDIMKDFIPTHHLKFASARRVKALLLEEIALDKMATRSTFEEQNLLEESETLHKLALELSVKAFGENNVQTAKHYGNLGRLYQTMRKFEEAEKMHQKAIHIKMQILGPYHYEVGLSIGHLASLYNFQMKRYAEAEQLYLRSIDIGIRLFGKTYSGLEYDYLGLCHIYEDLNEIEKYLEYAHLLDEWQHLRLAEVNRPIYPEAREDTTVAEVTKKFFEMQLDSSAVANSIAT